jgi:hypothetical protein
MRINDFLTLSSRMTDLRPKVITRARAGGCPSGQCLLHHLCGLILDYDVARALKVECIYLNITR